MVAEGQGGGAVRAFVGGGGGGGRKARQQHWRESEPAPTGGLSPSPRCYGVFRAGCSGRGVQGPLGRACWMVTSVPVVNVTQYPGAYKPPHQ